MWLELTVFSLCAAIGSALISLGFYPYTFVIAPLALAFADNKINLRIAFALLPCALFYPMIGTLFPLTALASMGGWITSSTLFIYIGICILVAAEHDRELSFVPLVFGAAMLCVPLVPWCLKKPVRFVVIAALIMHVAQALCYIVLHIEAKIVALMSFVFYTALLLRAVMGVVFQSYK